MQKGKPIVYASRAMKSAEQNCAQIEKEMLAISLPQASSISMCMEGQKWAYRPIIYLVAITIAAALQS